MKAVCCPESTFKTRGAMGIFGKWGKDAKAAGEAQLLEAATKGDAGLVEKLLGKGRRPTARMRTE